MTSLKEQWLNGERLLTMSMLLGICLSNTILQLVKTSGAPYMGITKGPLFKCLGLDTWLIPRLHAVKKHCFKSTKAF
jgi:hypothetical protein